MLLHCSVTSRLLVFCLGFFYTSVHIVPPMLAAIPFIVFFPEESGVYSVMQWCNFFFNARLLTQKKKIKGTRISKWGGA